MRRLGDLVSAKKMRTVGGVCKVLCQKSMYGRWRWARARAGWRVWELGNGTIMLRKANWEKTLQKSLKFFDWRKSIRKQIRPSCRKIFRPHFVFVGFVKATKFRDSSEYSQCVENVLSKNCLPLISFSDLLWMKPKARSGKVRKFVFLDWLLHLTPVQSPLWRGFQRQTFFKLKF